MQIDAMCGTCYYWIPLRSNPSIGLCILNKLVKGASDKGSTCYKMCKPSKFEYMWCKDCDPHPALKRARFPPHPQRPSLILGLPERFVGSPLGSAHITLSASPFLGHHSSGPGGLGPGGTIGPPSHTGLLDYNCVDRALNLLISSLERRSFPVVIVSRDDVEDHIFHELHAPPHLDENAHEETYFAS